MQRKWKNQAEKQSAYVIRKREKDEAAPKLMKKIAKMKNLDLRFFLANRHTAEPRSLLAMKSRHTDSSSMP